MEAAFELSRKGGSEQVGVKSIAEKLGCSVQPIYSYCKSMEGLRQDVIKRAEVFIQEYLKSHIDRKDFFRSTGQVYVRLAKEEPYIFQMFVMHKREGIASLDDLYQTETNPEVADFIAETLHISVEKARALHMNMLIYTVGIGTILATAVPGIQTEEIVAQMEGAYEAFSKQILNQEGQNE